MGSADADTVSDALIWWVLDGVSVGVGTGGREIECEKVSITLMVATPDSVRVSISEKVGVADSVLLMSSVNVFWDMVTEGVSDCRPERDRSSDVVTVSDPLAMKDPVTEPVINSVILILFVLMSLSDTETVRPNVAEADLMDDGVKEKLSVVDSLAEAKLLSDADTSIESVKLTDVEDVSDADCIPVIVSVELWENVVVNESVAEDSFEGLLDADKSLLALSEALPVDSCELESEKVEVCDLDPVISSETLELCDFVEVRSSENVLVRELRGVRDFSFVVLCVKVYVWDADNEPDIVTDREAVTCSEGDTLAMEELEGLKDNVTLLLSERSSVEESDADGSEDFEKDSLRSSVNEGESVFDRTSCDSDWVSEDDKEESFEGELDTSLETESEGVILCCIEKETERVGVAVRTSENELVCVRRFLVKVKLSVLDKDSSLVMVIVPVEESDADRGSVADEVMDCMFVTVSEAVRMSVSDCV